MVYSPTMAFVAMPTTTTNLSNAVLLSPSSPSSPSYSSPPSQTCIRQTCCSSFNSTFTTPSTMLPIAPPPSSSSNQFITNPSTFTLSPSTHSNCPPTSPSPCGLRMLIEKPAPSSASTSDFSSTELSETRRSYLYDFITSGPVYKSARLTIRPEDDPSCVTDSYQTCVDDWIEMGSILQDALGPQSNDIRVFHYYLPVYFWILRELDRHLERERNNPNIKHRPFILGFCCPQGGGKTTMSTFMETLLRSMGKNVQIASLDDFYVTNAEQNEIAKKYDGNRIMQYRGMPGTHDVALLTKTLDSLRNSKPVSIPRYDKSLFEGRGDRSPRDQWKHISESTDVVLLEGWCLGFEPVHIDNLVDENLEAVNDALADFVKVYSRLDGLFLIEIGDMDWVYDWRLQAERASRGAGKSGLTDDQVIDFVDRFMPAYKQYCPPLYNRKIPLIPRHELHIQIDQNRCPIQHPLDQE